MRVMFGGLLNESGRGRAVLLIHDESSRHLTWTHDCWKPYLSIYVYIYRSLLFYLFDMQYIRSIRYKSRCRRKGPSKGGDGGRRRGRENVYSLTMASLFRVEAELQDSNFIIELRGVSLLLLLLLPLLMVQL